MHSRPSAGIRRGRVRSGTQTDKDTFWTHELRLASETDSKLPWQVGSFYYDNHCTTATFRSLAVVRVLSKSRTSRDTKACSDFAEATYPITTLARYCGPALRLRPRWRR